MAILQKNTSVLSAIFAVIGLSLTSLSAFSSDAKCPLTEAVIKSDIAKVKNLLAKGSSVDGLDCPNPAGWPPLVFAVIGNNLPLVDVLLVHGANPSFRSNEPLVMAAGRGRTKIVEVFLKHGANPNVLDVIQQTPLYSASTCYAFWHDKNDQADADCVSTVRMLVAGGAMPNLPNRNGETPLFIAAYWGVSKVVKELLAQGADVNVISRLDETPLTVAIKQYADQKYSKSMHQPLISPPMLPTIKALLEAGADPNFAYGGRWEDDRDKSWYPYTAGYTVLTEVARYGWYEVAELLLQHGADPGLQREDGKSPSEVALDNGHAKTARLIARFAKDRETHPQ